MRLCAVARFPAIRRNKQPSLNARIIRVSLLVAQRLYGIKFGSTCSRIQPGSQADKERESDGYRHQPPRHCPEIIRTEGLAPETDVRSHIDDSANGPADRDAHQA